MKRVLMAACTLASMVASAQSPKIEFTAPKMYPEGVVYDEGSDAFYVSSVTTGSIGKVTTAGVYSVLLADTSLKSTFGMKVDRKANKLWVLAGDPTYSMYRDSATYKKMIRLLSVDLATGQKSSDIDLSAIFPGKHFGNDLAMDDKGNMYITDSYAPVIYKVDAAGKASVFAQSDWFHSAGVGLNGIVWHPLGFLLVANNGTGTVLKVDGSDPRRVSKVKVTQFFPGADGLALDNENNLLLVQNKGVNKVFRLKSTDNWLNASVIAATQAKDMFSYPSTLTMRKAEVWVMNAKMQEISDSTMGPSNKFAIQQAVFVPVK